MGKNTRGQKERSREQELKHENSKLRRQISALRRQIARLDLDRYSHLRDMLDEKLNEDDQEKREVNIIEQLKKTWTCYNCGQGHLEIIPYSKMGTTWYYRKCTNCPHRTEGKVYDAEKVKGIKREVLKVEVD